MISKAAPASFRDRAGFVFFESGVPYRQVNASYEPHFRKLIESGLASELQAAGLLVKHEESDFRSEDILDAIAVLKPEPIPFISYPYEWCFSQIKDAALCTLDIQKRALAKGLTLKDASAYNIQFLKGKPVFIDTLSFEIYEEGQPWIAYGQFCRHFLAPLALMAKVDPFLGRLCRTSVDGIPIEVVSKLLPGNTKWNLGLQMHVHMHAKAQNSAAPLSLGATAPSASSVKAKRMSKTGLLGLLDSLESTVKGLSWKPEGTVWGDYYDNTNYSKQAMSSKHSVVSEMLATLGPRVVWDLGSNTGEFSTLAAAAGASVIAWDLDPAAVEKHYASLKERSEERILPLVQDLANPSPTIGWALKERDSIQQRSNADTALALALIHHLAIGNNVPFEEQARFFARLAGHLIVEFVPKMDSQVQKMLMTRTDPFDWYDQDRFETAFDQYFRVVRKALILDSDRTLYLMERLGPT